MTTGILGVPLMSSIQQESITTTPSSLSRVLTKHLCTVLATVSLKHLDPDILPITRNGRNPVLFIDFLLFTFFENVS